MRPYRFGRNNQTKSAILRQALVLAWLHFSLLHTMFCLDFVFCYSYLSSYTTTTFFLSFFCLFLSFVPHLYVVRYKPQQNKKIVSFTHTKLTYFLVYWPLLSSSDTSVFVFLAFVFDKLVHLHSTLKLCST
eukprot:m.203016 g.203016  ORF g.203016 m.203016 type:complete len:131 (+) comp14985_c0_seq1:1928-2320(+)